MVTINTANPSNLTRTKNGNTEEKKIFHLRKAEIPDGPAQIIEDLDVF